MSIRRAIFVILVGCCAPSSAWADLTPSDPFWVPYQVPYESNLNLPKAWGYSTGSSSVIVALLDTGVVTTTPQLAGRLLPALSTVDGGATGPYSDSTLIANSVLAHGTYLAGTIGMKLDDSTAGAGIGNFTILPITVTNTNGNNVSEWIADAIRLAADQGARVINVSQGTLNYGELDAAAAYARTKGALTFVAAGNSDAYVTLPASYANLIFVSGVDRNDNRWVSGGQGSTYGPFVNLAAPADFILATNATASTDATLTSNYVLVDGTSEATAIASGAAALAWSINPALTPDQVQSLLYSTADHPNGPIPNGALYSDVYGNGRLNVGNLAAAAFAVPEPSTLVLGVIGAACIGLFFRRQRIRR